MKKAVFSNPTVIIALLLLQFAPLVLFPAASFTIKSQEWWLPVLLALLNLIAAIRVILKRDETRWPWYVFGFSQGFNIISRLMMIMPHAMINVDKVQVFNTNYIVLTLVSMAASAFFLVFLEMPEVRMGMART